MKNLLILGAGTGGALLSNLFEDKLPDDWSITVIDKAKTHKYQPGFLFLPFRLYGYETAEDVERPIQSPISNKATFVNAAAKAIDHQKKTVETEAGTYNYDFLIIALGSRVVPEDVDGLAEAFGPHADTYYTLEGALNLQKIFDSFTEGRVVLNIADMPIKCPVAPIEFVFLADYYFHQKEMRDRTEITLVTPLTGAFTKPQASKVLGQVAEEKGIKVIPNFQISEVDGDKRVINSFDGQSVPYDLLVSIPPHSGSDVVDEAGLGDGTGFVVTDKNTLKAKMAENIYAIGDITNVPTSKAGSVAHFEAEVVVENILREIEGKEPIPDFDGHSNCFIESGFHKALLFDFNYDTEPLPGSFPLGGHLGPFSLLKESYLNHYGKMAFKWVYWNLLLTGHLPGDPLLPSHMSMVGKDSGLLKEKR